MQPTVTHSTFVIERNFPAGPERVFEAFADPEKKRLWLAGRASLPGGQFKTDFRVGGFDTVTSVMGDDTPFPGTPLTNHTVYQDIVPNRRIVFAYTMTVGNRRISASLATVELLPSGTGTDLIFTDQGAYLEGADGPEIRKAGWDGLLNSLEKSVAA